MMIVRTALTLVAALFAASPASALDRVLGTPRIMDNGDLRLSPDVKIGRYTGGKLTFTPDSIVAPADIRGGNLCSDDTVYTPRLFQQRSWTPATSGENNNALYTVNTGPNVGVSLGIFYQSAANQSTFDTAVNIIGVFDGVPGSTISRSFLNTFRVSLSPNSTSQPFGGLIEEINPVNRGLDTGYQPDNTGFISYGGNTVAQTLGAINVVPEQFTFGQPGEGKHTTYAFAISRSGAKNSTVDYVKTYAGFQSNPDSLVPYTGLGGGGRLVSAYGGKVDASAPGAVLEAQGFWSRGIDFSKAILNGAVASATNGGALILAAGQRIVLDVAQNIGLSSTGGFVNSDAGLRIRDGGGVTYPTAWITQAGSLLTQIGINDSSFGAQTTASQGGFLRMDARTGVQFFQFWARPASGGLSPVATIDNGGNAGFSGSVTASSTLTGASLKLASTTTVAGLPACNGSTQDMTRIVTDASAPTYRGKLTGGAAVRTPVYCDGSSWTAH